MTQPDDDDEDMEVLEAIGFPELVDLATELNKKGLALEDLEAMTMTPEERNKRIRELAILMSKVPSREVMEELRRLHAEKRESETRKME